MEWFPKATQQSSAGGTQHPWHSPGQTEPWAVLLQQALARLMKQLPNETGHLIRIYIKEKKNPAKNQRIVHLYLSISSWFQAPLRLKKEQSCFKQLLFKQLNSFPDQSWILKLLKHQLPSENEGRSSQEIKWFPSRPFLLAVCLPTGSRAHEPGAVHFQSVMGSFHGLHSEQPRAAEGACAWPFLLIGKR